MNGNEECFHTFHSFLLSCMELNLDFVKGFIIIRETCAHTLKNIVVVGGGRSAGVVLRANGRRGEEVGC